MVDTPSQTDTYSTALDIFDRTHPLRVDVDENLKITGTVTTVPSGSQNVKVHDGAGNSLTSTFESGKQALDVNIAGGAVVTLINFATRVDTFTVPADGVAVNVSATPLKNFSIQVKSTGGVATAWDVFLEGSLDGITYTPTIEHTQDIGDGLVVYSGALFFPALYFRSRCNTVTLGAATNLVVTILGVV